MARPREREFLNVLLWRVTLSTTRDFSRRSTKHLHNAAISPRFSATSQRYCTIFAHMHTRNVEDPFRSLFVLSWKLHMLLFDEQIISLFNYQKTNNVSRWSFHIQKNTRDLDIIGKVVWTCFPFSKDYFSLQVIIRSDPLLQKMKIYTIYKYLNYHVEMWSLGSSTWYVILSSFTRCFLYSHNFLKIRNST